MNVVWNHITSVQQASRHVFAVAWITLNHLVVWLEARHGDLLNRVGLVLSLCRRDDWSICHQWEVDAWVGDEVGLELGQIDVEGAIKSKGSSDGRNNCVIESA